MASILRAYPATRAINDISRIARPQQNDVVRVQPTSADARQKRKFIFFVHEKKRTL